MELVNSFDNIPEEERQNFLSTLIAMWEFAGEFPTLTSLLENFPFNEIELRQLLIEHCNPRLIQRGYPKYDKIPEEVKSRFQPEFDPLFMLVAERVVDPTSTKSLAARIKEFEAMGVSTNTWTNWLKNPKYKVYVQGLIEKSFDSTVNIAADINLAKLVVQGDLKAIMAYKQITNRFNPASQNEQNLATLLGILLRIISEKVKDPEVIEAIAMEFEATPVGQLMSGGQ